MTRIMSFLAVGVLSAAIAVAQAPQGGGPTLQPLWTLTGDFLAPESAYYDAGSNAVFVSSINGQILEKDGNGYISRLSPEGKVVSPKWVTGLNAPKGLRSVGGTLWVSDIDEVVSIDIATARITARVRVEGAQFLNDLATAPDGTVYVSDSGLFQVFAVKDGKASVFLQKNDIGETPNGLLVDGTRLILGTIGGGGPRGAGAPPPPTGHLYAYNLKTKQRTQLTTQAVGGIDGIEPDGRGGILVTDVIGQRLLHVPASGEVRVLAQFTAAGADFGWIAAKRLAIVPFLFTNTVFAYDLTASLK
jgi:DNA-binding beta-propeller fold protein YncE